MTNLDSILRSRDINLPTKVRLVKAMVFPVVMYGCERWTVKKAEGQRIDAFEMWCWRRLLRVPWTARRSNQSILKGILCVHWKNWCWYWNSNIWPPDAKSWLTGKDPDAGKDWRQEKKGTTENEMARWHHRLDGHEFEQALGVGDGQRSLACYSPWGHKESDTTESLNWTECNLIKISISTKKKLLWKSTSSFKKSYEQSKEQFLNRKTMLDTHTDFETFQKDTIINSMVVLM